MTNIASKETVRLIIGKSEALILFELLHDFHRQPTLEIKDGADRLALVRVHGALESTRSFLSRPDSWVDSSPPRLAPLRGRVSLKPV
jgi:hypothetical protein